MIQPTSDQPQPWTNWEQSMAPREGRGVVQEALFAGVEWINTTVPASSSCHWQHGTKGLCSSASFNNFLLPSHSTLSSGARQQLPSTHLHNQIQGPRAGPRPVTCFLPPTDPSGARKGDLDSQRLKCMHHGTFSSFSSRGLK